MRTTRTAEGWTLPLKATEVASMETTTEPSSPELLPRRTLPALSDTAATGLDGERWVPPPEILARGTLNMLSDMADRASAVFTKAAGDGRCEAPVAAVGRALPPAAAVGRALPTPDEDADEFAEAVQGLLRHARSLSAGTRQVLKAQRRALLHEVARALLCLAGAQDAATRVHEMEQANELRVRAVAATLAGLVGSQDAPRAIQGEETTSTAGARGKEREQANELRVRDVAATLAGLAASQDAPRVTRSKKTRSTADSQDTPRVTRSEKTRPTAGLQDVPRGTRRKKTKSKQGMNLRGMAKTKTKTTATCKNTKRARDASKCELPSLASLRDVDKILELDRLDHQFKDPELRESASADDCRHLAVIIDDMRKEAERTGKDMWSLPFVAAYLENWEGLDLAPETGVYMQPLFETDGRGGVRSIKGTREKHALAYQKVIRDLYYRLPGLQRYIKEHPPEIESNSSDSSDSFESDDEASAAGAASLVGTASSKTTMRAVALSVTDSVAGGEGSESERPVAGGEGSEHTRLQSTTASSEPTRLQSTTASSEPTRLQSTTASSVPARPLETLKGKEPMLPWDTTTVPTPTPALEHNQCNDRKRLRLTFDTDEDFVFVPGICQRKQLNQARRARMLVEDDDVVNLVSDEEMDA